MAYSVGNALPRVMTRDERFTLIKTDVQSESSLKPSVNRVINPMRRSHERLLFVLMHLEACANEPSHVEPSYKRKKANRD